MAKILKTGSAYYRHQSFGMAVKGFSVEWQDNLPEVKRVFKKTAEKARAAARHIIREWGTYVRDEAAKRAPSYGGDLANAIQVSYSGLHNNRYGSRVGVSVDWKSDFDEDYMNSRKKDPPWGVSSPQLAMLIHEEWESIVDTGGLKRAATKGARYGVTVGSGFLTRAIEENMKEMKGVAKTTFISYIQGSRSDIFDSDVPF